MSSQKKCTPKLSEEEKRLKKLEYGRQWRKRHPDYQLQWRKNNPDHNREWRLRKGKEYRRSIRLEADYGLTTDQFDQILSHQSGRCAICETAFPGGRHNRWHVDHDHCTGKVRGLLCSNCNWMLGNAKDDPEIILAAINYLNDPPAPRILSN